MMPPPFVALWRTKRLPAAGGELWEFSGGGSSASIWRSKAAVRWPPRRSSKAEALIDTALIAAMSAIAVAVASVLHWI